MSLFRCNNSPIHFDIVGLSDGELGEVTRIIVQNGGSVGKADNQRIKFAKSSKIVDDVAYSVLLYDIQFIKDCVENNAIVDPASYRIGIPLQYDDCLMHHFLNGSCDCIGNHGANSFKQSINDIELKLTKREERRNAFKTVRKRRGRGVAISPAESRRILAYLNENDLIEKTRSLRMWKEVIDEGICSNRSPLSLYQHFKKRILPRIEKFNLTKTQLTNIRRLQRS